MVWRLPVAALVALVIGLPLAMLFDIAVRGVSLLHDPYAAAWYRGLAVVAFPLCMIAISLAGVTLSRRGRRALPGLQWLAIGGAILGTMLGLLGAILVGGDLATLAIGYAMVFGTASGVALWLLYHRPLAIAARAG